MSKQSPTVPLKPDWMDKPKDKFPARKSAKELGKSPTRKTAKQIRGEEDEQSVSKKIKKTGKVTIKGPNVKERKHFAPPTKTEDPKKGKGSYTRKKVGEEDEEKSCWKGYEKKGVKKKGDKKVPNCVPVSENTNIANFIDALLRKNYAAADKYIKLAVETKLQSKIEQELSTPLF